MVTHVIHNHTGLFDIPTRDIGRKESEWKKIDIGRKREKEKGSERKGVREGERVRER